ncbi:MAG: hypothetical protein AB1324_08065 [Candidatus Micrarchaeota archaeon]
MGFVLERKPDKGKADILLKADIPLIETLRALDVVYLRLFNKQDGSSAMLRLVNENPEGDGGSILLTVSQTREEFLESLRKDTEAVFWNDLSRSGVRFRANLAGKDEWLGDRKPMCEPIQ